MEHHQALSQHSTERWVSNSQKGAEHFVSSLEKEYESLDYETARCQGSLAAETWAEIQGQGQTAGCTRLSHA